MNSNNRRGTRWSQLVCVLLGVGMLTTLAGCPGSNPRGPGGGSGDPNTAPVPTFGIQNIQSNVAFSEAIELTILYSVPQGSVNVEGFYRVLNAPFNSGGSPIGIEEVVATDLPAGDNQSFPFNTSDLRPGFYQMGIRADGLQELSRGTIELQGPPAPFFLDPSEDVTVSAGTDVDIVVDVGDPQGRAKWRLFFQAADAPQNEEGEAPSGQLLGTRLKEGSGVSVDFSWDTTNVTPGLYRFGVSATDSGLTVVGAVSSGRADTIVTVYSEAVVTVQPAPTDARPPTLTFQTMDQFAFGGESVIIDFVAESFDTEDYIVTLFYVFNDVTTTLPQSPIVDPAVTSVTFDTMGLATGVYEIGGTIDDGLNDVVEVAESDRVLINVIQIADAELGVSAPGEPLEVPRGAEVTIEWSTNVPPLDGRTIRVFARQCASTACDESDLGTGADIAIASDLGLGTTSTSWDTSPVSGRHVLLVEMTLADQSPTITLTERAPGSVRVRQTPLAIWVGSLGVGSRSLRAGEVYQGVQPQDNAGTFAMGVGDYNADGRDEFMITARFGKPFFQNPEGIGIGEGYMIYGGERRRETHNLNKVALAELKGLAFTAPLPLETAQTATDGLASFRTIPDQDGDGLPELAFGLPYIKSRGHSRRIYVNRNPTLRDTLEQSEQFERGGVVFYSSRNSKLADPPTSGDPDAPLRERPVVHLDLVGQNFQNMNIEYFDGDPRGCGSFYDVDLWQTEDEQITDPITGIEMEILRCVRDESGQGGGQDDCFETFRGSTAGFSRALATSVGPRCRPFSRFLGSDRGMLCECFNSDPNPDDQQHAGLWGDQRVDHQVLDSRCGHLGLLSGSVTSTEIDSLSIHHQYNRRLGSGFYPLDANAPREPFGARLIGNSPGNDGSEATTGDKFGSWIAISGGFLIISAPNRQPHSVELLQQPDGALTDAGIMVLLNMNNLWPDFNADGSAPPLPFQYQMGPFPAPFDAIGTTIGGTPEPGLEPFTRNAPSHCGRDALFESFPSPFRIVGETSQKIEFVEGIPDFNLDGREDLIVGAPLADAGDGAVNILFRRDPFLEGDYLLEKLTLDPDDLERLAGLRINGRAGAQEGFGEVIARSRLVRDPDSTDTGGLVNQTLDFNDDGHDDVILGNPRADVGANVDAGEVIVVFATNDMFTGLGGMDVDDLIAASAQVVEFVDGILIVQDVPRAIRITGANAGDLFGFNVAVVGDFNGDGENDLLVAAPGASPEYDSDDDGTLDTPGIDVINLLDPNSPFGDGIPDDIDFDGIPDLLTGAGHVYLIFGVSNLVALAGEDRTISISELGTSAFSGIVFVGRTDGDALGGGTTTREPTPGNMRTFRSFGIGGAGDVDGDGREDILLSSMLADPGNRTNAGEVYLIYGFTP